MKILKKISRFFRLLYLKLVRINDSPARIALGFAIGVFVGNIPGMGPIAALFCAYILRINRASALIGSLLVNTWFSVVTLLLSIKIGSAVLGLDWHTTQQQLQDFSWHNLLKLEYFKIILPPIVGYLIISLSLSILAYIISLAILHAAKSIKYSRHKH